MFWWSSSPKPGGGKASRALHLLGRSTSRRRAPASEPCDLQRAARGPPHDAVNCFLRRTTTRSRRCHAHRQRLLQRVAFSFGLHAKRARPVAAASVTPAWHRHTARGRQACRRRKSHRSRRTSVTCSGSLERRCDFPPILRQNILCRGASSPPRVYVAVTQWAAAHAASASSRSCSTPHVGA